MKFIIISFFVVIFCFGLFYKPVFVFAGDTCYVDEDADDNGDGRIDDPYVDIEEALYKECEKIIIKNGIYKEDIVIGKYVEIEGEELDNVIIAGTITMKDKSKINNLTIADGGIDVEDSADVVMEYLKVKNTDTGITTAGAGKLIMKKVQFYQNQKAIFISEGRDVEIVENEIYDNEGSGMNIQINVSGVIKDNIMRDNEANGIIVITGSDSLEISNNEFKDNKSSGIVVKYNKQGGEFTDLSIKNNIISSNKDFGVVCDVITTINPGEDYWKKKLGLKENKFHNNDAGKFSKACEYIKKETQQVENDKKNTIQQKDVIIKQEQKLYKQLMKERELQANQQRKEFEKKKQEEHKKEELQIKMRDALQQEVFVQKNIEDMAYEIEKLYNVDIITKKELESRPKIIIFLIGPNYKKLRTMAENMVEYDRKIELAIDMSTQVQNEIIAKQINQDIFSMKQKKKEILNTAIEYNKKFSLFGYFFKKDA
jgi:hypothetical protein